jgi:hypothetical protein
MSKLLFVFLVAALFSSCTLLTGSQNVATAPSSVDIAVFQKSFMSSYFAERSSAASGVAGGARALTPFAERSATASRATVNVSPTRTYSFAAVAGKTTTIPSYPESDQTTSFTVTLVTGTPASTAVYDVTATTTFPAGDIRASYVEEYYVQDVGLNSAATPWNTGATPDGQWTIDDPIVKRGSTGGWSLDAVDGINGYFTEDPAARIEMLLTFSDGSTRTETIVSSSRSGGPKFSPVAFDVAGSLDLGQAFIPAIAGVSENVMFSSVVMYYVSPKPNYSFWFWQGNDQQTILGVRYYTEAADTADNRYVGHTASFEKTVGELTTTGGAYAATMKTIFAGSQSPILAESVLRQKVDYALVGTSAAGTDYYRAGAAQDRTTNMQTRVVNIAGQKDFFLSQLGTDSAQLSSWASSTLYIPEGSATEILATTPSNLVFQKSDYSVTTAGMLPLATASVANGLGELATVYGSIQSGAATLVLPSSIAPSSNVMPNVVWTFNGQQVAGATTDPTTIPVLTTSGTVEAWVYIDTMTDTMGIVHKGVKTDFTDEAYSLQGWSSGGQIAMIVDRNGNYDAAFSDINLNTKKWYYIAGVWDVTGGNKYVKLYINGVLHGSGTASVTYPLGTTDSSSIGMMVGSQLPASYNSAWGYFGVNGKIVGVNLSASPLSDADVKTKYDANSGNTMNW